MSALVQITPTYPPDRSGVGDYAAVLTTRFRGSSRSLATLVAQPGASTVEDVSYIPRNDAETLAQAIDGYDSVLLHFSGYGYARRGLCRWLVDGLERWKARGQGRRLVTMFHEVYATGPVWRASFWTSAPQKLIARDLGRLSNVAFVSSRGGYDQLRSLCPDRPLEILGVFSNVGELDAPRPLAKRSAHAVVFGGAGRRMQVYRALQAAGEGSGTALRHCGVTRVFDIGPWVDVPHKVGGCAVQACGPIPAADVSDLLSHARLGFVDYRRDKIMKSGIAAAYFAHGVFVVNTGTKGHYTPDIQECVHLADLWRLRDGSCDAPEIAAAGWERYQRHGIEPTVRRLRKALEQEQYTPSEKSPHA